ncbi:aspartate aminotransferase family protein [Chondromyces crocatus]|uniref:Acetylornithine aminotransferase n=1 Tax=Chondromyces crocatus TaxID=52 RepID=A0A0K1E4W1_CHOCO|nr:acetylornithine transaminase [Chondromyces crocatus]AKT35894.1 acetylornithine aminotransferase [Chondromyces crocatus]
MTIATPDLLALGETRLLGNYRQAPFVLERGAGCELFDTEGRRYLDLCAGVAVSALGHAHPRLVAALAAQAARLIHTSNYFYNRENLLLAEELCQKTGFDRAFFCNSGAEANEALLKLARRYHFSRGEPHRYRVIAFHNAFHGRTLGAVALTGTPKYREGFGPPLQGVTHVSYGDVEAVKAAMGPDVAGILVEPVQGEGGVLPPPEGFLKALRDIADEHGALLLLDEVQTGIGRTGHWLGCQHDGVLGDAAALAKGLGGGFPIGALVLREHLNAALPPGSHGSTYGGGPLASTAARTVLAVIEEEGLCEAARRNGERLARGLAGIAARHPRIATGERGRGLLRALVLAEGVDPRKALGAVRDRGILLTVAGADALRFTPPLVISEAQIDEALHNVEIALAEAFA